MANGSYLSTFGGGHDFMLCDNCNTTNSSYSNFGHTYDIKGVVKESLCGAYNFTTKEVEVFQVIYTGDLLVGEKDKIGKTKSQSKSKKEKKIKEVEPEPEIEDSEQGMGLFD